MEDITSKFGFNGCVDSRIGGRQENQDSYGVADTPLGTLVVVCDGMGGGPAGKTASGLATSTILSVVSSCKPQDNPERILLKAVESANSALMGAVSANPSLRGMGTTCVALLLNRKTAYIVHVGDSRCYVLRDGKVAFRTADHSFVAEMVRKGELTEEQARLSNKSNVITRAIGIRPTVEAEFDKVSIKGGDRFTLMTDGIWGALPEVHLVSALCVDEELPLVVSELVDRVDAMGHNNGGHHDNMTLAVMDFPVGNKQDKSPKEKVAGALAPQEMHTKIRKPRLQWILASLLVFSLGVNAYLGVSFLINDEDTYFDSSLPEEFSRKEFYNLKREVKVLRDSLKRTRTSQHSGGTSHSSVKKKELLQKAIDYLSQLDTLGKGGIDTKSKNGEKLLKELRSKRDKMHKGVCSNLRQAVKVCDVHDEQEVVRGLYNHIKSNNKIVCIDRQGRPTKEARDTIKKYIGLIRTTNK